MNLEYPDFLIVGGTKCGTTSLYYTLLNHKDIIGPDFKEIQYFNSLNGDKGIDWYLSQFPKKQYETQLLCECSPAYGLKSSIDVIKNAFLGKKLKLIYIIRNPVDRFISQYIHFKALYYAVNDAPNLLEEIAKEKEFYHYKKILRSPWRGEAEFLKNIILNKGPNNHYYEYGKYINIIQAIENQFGKSNFHLIIFDDFVKNPNIEISKILNFLNVENVELQLENKNKGEFWKTVHDSSNQINPDLIEILKEHYKPFNEALYKHINRDLGW